MTIKQEIQQDTVAMRWLRTAATTVTSVAAAVVVGYAVVEYTFGPRITGWAEAMIDAATEEIRQEVDQTSEQTERLERVVTRLEESLLTVGTAFEEARSPSWRFDAQGTTITDGRVGGSVVITAAGYKLRECGTPRVDLYFINGGGIYHRFQGSSLLSPDGRGVAFPVSPDRVQSVRYVATIPADDGVTPGRASGYIAVSYPDGCPQVPEVVAGPLQFRISGS